MTNYESMTDEQLVAAWLEKGEGWRYSILAKRGMKPLRIFHPPDYAVGAKFKKLPDDPRIPTCKSCSRIPPLDGNFMLRVIEEMIKKHRLLFRMHNNPFLSKPFVCEFVKGLQVQESSLPIAVVIAALRALEASEKEKVK